MILSPAYSRVAVRPFPLTDQMKQIIRESMGGAHRVIQHKVEGRSYGGPLYTIWDGIVSGRSSKDFHLIVEMKLETTNTENTGYAQVDEEESEATVHLEIVAHPFFGGYAKYLKNPGFWTNFSQLLHHELVHVFDPKVWSAGVRGKQPEFIHPHESGDFEGYMRAPAEVSAFGAESYHYFKNKKEQGVSLAEAIRNFLSGRNPSERYREVTKRGDPQRWKDYLTRVYKSAEQAYQDVGEVSEA